MFCNVIFRNFMDIYGIWGSCYGNLRNSTQMLRNSIHILRNITELYGILHNFMEFPGTLHKVYGTLRTLSMLANALELYGILRKCTVFYGMLHKCSSGISRVYYRTLLEQVLVWLACATLYRNLLLCNVFVASFSFNLQTFVRTLWNYFGTCFILASPCDFLP